MTDTPQTAARGVVAADTDLETETATAAEAAERSVVLPVYDESPDLLTEMVADLREAGWDEVVVCADRPDPAMRETLDVAAESPGVRVSASDARRGKGGALADGLGAAAGDVIGYVDADGAVPVDELDRLYDAVESDDAAVAVGSRDAGNGARAHQSRVRRGLGAGYRKLSGTLVDTPVDDVQCGAKAFAAEVWDAVGDEVSETGFAFDTELVARAYRRGFEVSEVGIDWSEPGESTVNPVRDAPKMLSALFRIRRSLPAADEVADAAADAAETATDAAVTVADSAADEVTGAAETAADVSAPADRSAADVSVSTDRSAADSAAGDAAEPEETLELALVTAHPPTQGHLAEYGEKLAESYRDRDDVRLTVLAPVDGVGDDAGAADGATAGDAATADASPDDRGYAVRRVWERDSVVGAARLLRELRDGGYDAVQFNVHMTYFGDRNVHRFLGLSLPPLASLICDARVVTTLHDLLEVVADDAVDEDVGFVHRVGAKAATQLLLRCEATTVTSEEYRDTVLDGYRVAEDAVHHVPHGTFARAEADGGRPTDDGPFRVMVFGHLGPTKDVDTVVAAVDRLVDRRDGDVELVVAGDSHPQHPDYRERLESEYADRPHVRFTGYVDDDEMEDVWNAASLLVMPYATCTGVSGVYQLAKSYGTPVVAFDSPGMRNSTVETGGAATFVAPGDADALADELARLADAPDERREMARENAAAATEFTIDDAAGEMVAVMRGESR